MDPYKLKAEIREFILQKAKEHPELGCRKLAGLIQETFQANISKSSISSVLKSAGLNKTIGRRRIRQEALPAPVPAIQNPEAITKLNDVSYHCEESACGGRLINPNLEMASLPFLPAGRQAVARNDEERLQKTEQLSLETQECGNWFLKAAELCLGGIPGIENTHNPENIKSISHQISTKIFSEMVSSSVEALALRFILEDNSFFFLDASGHSIWTTERIPECLSVGLYKTRTYLNEHIISGRQPLILQAAPGFDTPTPAFSGFIDAFQAEKPEKAIKSIELYSADKLLIDTIDFARFQKKRYFIIGLWPWQYKNRDFKLPVSILPIRGSDNNRKLDIITNLELDKQSNEEIIGHYLSRWPNLESGYQDLLDKIGHFIRSPKTRARDKSPILPNAGEELSYEQLLNFWKLILNSYCQRHFFPSSYQELDFLILQERFYHLEGKTNPTASAFIVKFMPPQDFSYLKDLQYACQRLNEADIRLGNGLRLGFEIP